MTENKNTLPETEIGRPAFLRTIAALGLGWLVARPHLSAAETTPTTIPDDIRNFGARGDGKSDDSEAIRKALKATGTAYVPTGPGLSFLIGEVEVSSRKVHGPGTLVLKRSQIAGLVLTGDGSSVEGVTFMAEGVSGQPHSDIRLGDGAKNVRITGCTFKSPIYSAVSSDENGDSDRSLRYKDRVTGVLISNCVFSGLYARPIYLHSVANITIQGNILRDCTHDAIRVRQNDGFCLIDGNQFINVGTAKDDDSKDAVDAFWSGRNLTISNNIITGTGVHGLDIKGSSPDGTYGTGQVLIHGNQIYQARFSGIAVSAASAMKDGNFRMVEGFTISGNIIQGCNLAMENPNDAAIHFRHGYARVLISGNQIIGNHSHGILVANFEKMAQTAHSVRISGNICANNGLDGKGGCGIKAWAVRNLIISENFCQNDPGAKNPLQQVGIELLLEQYSHKPPLETQILANNICSGKLKVGIAVGPNHKPSDLPHAQGNVIDLS